MPGQTCVSAERKVLLNDIPDDILLKIIKRRCFGSYEDLFPGKISRRTICNLQSAKIINKRIAKFSRSILWCIHEYFKRPKSLDMRLQLADFEYMKSIRVAKLFPGSVQVQENCMDRIFGHTIFGSYEENENFFALERKENKKYFSLIFKNFRIFTNSKEICFTFVNAIDYYLIYNRNDFDAINCIHDHISKETVWKAIEAFEDCYLFNRFVYIMSRTDHVKDYMMVERGSFGRLVNGRGVKILQKKLMDAEWLEKTRRIDDKLFVMELLFRCHCKGNFSFQCDVDDSMLPESEEDVYEIGSVSDGKNFFKTFGIFIELLRQSIDIIETDHGSEIVAKLLLYFNEVLERTLLTLNIFIVRESGYWYACHDALDIDDEKVNFSRLVREITHENVFSNVMLDGQSFDSATKQKGLRELLEECIRGKVLSLSSSFMWSKIMFMMDIYPEKHALRLVTGRKLNTEEIIHFSLDFSRRVVPES